MQFQLLVDRLDGSLAPLTVPNRVAYLTQALRLTKRAPRRSPLLALEVVRLRGRPELLAICSERLRLNGRRAPIVAPLRVRDQLQLEDGTIVHVSAFHPGLQSDPPQAGQVCPVCRTEIDTGPVYMCPCGTSMHCVDGDLECAKVGDCPSCQQPVRLQKGLVYEPEV